ncbi:MAG: UDP-4-amino-4,6-dideoxy-N-acetyl-beta-L-altrosamine transaminase [Rhodospirillales bacterium]
MTAHGRLLPYGRQTIEEDDIAAVAAVLRSPWLTGGPTVDRFEQAFAAKVGAEHAVACSSGTAALHLACLALGLGPGDGVVVPTLTFAATANSARFVGAEVVFADVDAETGLMRPDHLADAISRAWTSGIRVKAVCPVHLNGQTADGERVAAIARRQGLRVIEDCCHAVGAGYRSADGTWHPVGGCRHGEMAVFSLHPVKTVTMGEGGVVTTNDGALFRRLRRLRNHGIVREAAAFEDPGLGHGQDGTPNPWYYELPEVGYNYRASDIHCALGLSQLDKLGRFVAIRRHLAKCYDRMLRPLLPLVRPIGRVSGCRPAWHLYVVLIDFEAVGIGRGELMRRLERRGIGTQVHYVPLHLQPYYRRRYGELAMPGAQSYYARCLSLPLFPAMSEADVGRVVDALAASLREAVA